MSVSFFSRSRRDWAETEQRLLSWRCSNSVVCLLACWRTQHYYYTTFVFMDTVVVWWQTVVPRRFEGISLIPTIITHKTSIYRVQCNNEIWWTMSRTKHWQFIVFMRILPLSLSLWINMAAYSERRPSKRMKLKQKNREKCRKKEQFFLAHLIYLQSDLCPCFCLAIAIIHRIYHNNSGIYLLCRWINILLYVCRRSTN